MSLPVYRRKFQTFISSVNASNEVAEQIEHWLTDKAGIPVLHDIQNFQSGASMEDGLELCQSMLVLITKRGIESGRVKKEFELGVKQQARFGNLFHVIPVRVEECIIPDFLEHSAFVDTVESGFDMSAAMKLLSGLYSNGLVSGDGKTHDLFVSCPWSREEDALTKLVFKLAKRIGFRLIGNPIETHEKSDVSTSLISGCGGGIAVIPDGIGEKTMNKIISDLGIMSDLNLPFLVVMEKVVNLPDLITQHALEIVHLDKDTLSQDADLEKQIRASVIRLYEDWVSPPEQHYIFYGTDLKEEHKARSRFVRRAIQQITSMPCMMGEDIQRGQIQNEIINMIIGARMMIADISRENLNTCIEAGVAIGSHVPLNLLSGDERHKPPFMFRDRQIWHYHNELDLLGMVHKLVAPYRKFVI